MVILRTNTLSPSNLDRTATLNGGGDHDVEVPPLLPTPTPLSPLSLLPRSPRSPINKALLLPGIIPTEQRSRRSFSSSGDSLQYSSAAPTEDPGSPLSVLSAFGSPRVTSPRPTFFDGSPPHLRLSGLVGPPRDSVHNFLSSKNGLLSIDDGEPLPIEEDGNPDAFSGLLGNTLEKSADSLSSGVEDNGALKKSSGSGWGDNLAYLRAAYQRPDLGYQLRKMGGVKIPVHFSLLEVKAELPDPAAFVALLAGRRKAGYPLEKLFKGWQTRPSSTRTVESGVSGVSATTTKTSPQTTTRQEPHDKFQLDGNAPTEKAGGLISEKPAFELSIRYDSLHKRRRFAICPVLALGRGAPNRGAVPLFLQGAEQLRTRLRKVVRKVLLKTL